MARPYREAFGNTRCKALCTSTTAPHSTRATGLHPTNYGPTAISPTSPTCAHLDASCMLRPPPSVVQNSIPVQRRWYSLDMSQAPKHGAFGIVQHTVLWSPATPSSMNSTSRSNHSPLLHLRHSAHIQRLALR